MSFDNSISLGTMVSILTLVVGFVSIAVKMGAIKQIIETHGAELTRGTERMDKHDTLLLELVGDVRELIGRSPRAGERIG